MIKKNKLKTPLFLVILCVLVSFAGLYNHDLWTPDEPREAAITLEMSKTGDFVVPRLTGEPFVEKPPLYYITGALAIRTLAESVNSTWILRTTSAVWGLMTLLCVFGIGHRFFGKEHALTGTMALATMPGFVYVTHWLLVDNALLFFVVATMYFFVESYLGKREYFIIPAGVMLAGAFLTKGLIGPALVFPGWLALFLPWAIKTWKIRPGNIILRQTAIHIAGFIIFLALCSIWIIAFRKSVDDQLWFEWFWVNHFGRFKGQATHLGHIRGPFYYIPNFIVHTLPWLICIVIGVIAGILSVLKNKLKKPELLCLLAWGIGGMMLLSMSSTKREIYMIPVLPAFALLCPVALMSGYRKAAVISLTSWAIVCVCALVLLAAISVASVFIPETFMVHGVSKSEFIRAWGASSYIAAGGVLVCIALFLTRDAALVERNIAIAALSLVILLNTTLPILGLFKNYKHGFIEFSKGLGTYSGLRIAGWNFDETTKAGFYYYTDMAFPQIKEEDELHAVFSGDHPEFDAVIVLRKRSSAAKEEDPNTRTLQYAWLGRNRILKLLAGHSSKIETGN